jgi:hypothetical protein
MQKFMIWAQKKYENWQWMKKRSFPWLLCRCTSRPSRTKNILWLESIGSYAGATKRIGPNDAAEGIQYRSYFALSLFLGLPLTTISNKRNQKRKACKSKPSTRKNESNAPSGATGSRTRIIRPSFAETKAPTRLHLHHPQSYHLHWNSLLWSQSQRMKKQHGKRGLFSTYCSQRVT